MKIMLLAGLYLFFVRVLWSVFSELRDPRSVARKRREADAAVATAVAASTPRITDNIDVTARATTPHGSEPLAVANPGTAAAIAVATPAALGQLRMIEPATGAMFPLGSDITIGRAASNGIVLDDSYVSTVHARIFFANGTYVVEDLASRNGCTLNGEAIVATTALVPGDRLQVGATTLEFS